MKLRRLSSSAIAVISLTLSPFVAHYPSFSDPALPVKSSGMASATNSSTAKPQPAGSKSDASSKDSPKAQGLDPHKKPGAIAVEGKPSLPPNQKQTTQPAAKAAPVSAAASAEKAIAPPEAGAKDAGLRGASVIKEGAPVKAVPKGGEAATKSSKARGTSHGHNANSEQLIPPPPPVQPSLLLGPDFAGGMPFGFDGMNKDEVAKKAKELGQQLKDMQDVLKEKQDLVQEAKDKAARFKPLFEEGVVSRHELEAAEKEAVDADRELDRINRRVSEFQVQKQSVDSRLNDFNKKGSNGLATAKARKKKH
jgi:hypothetical protein